MTVDTAVNIEGEKRGLDMTSPCEDLPPSCVGGGGECNGDGKDDYVFVNGNDAASDDHVEIEGNWELNVSASNAVFEGKLEGVSLNVVNEGDQLETCNSYSGKLDYVVKVNGGKLKLENGVVKEEEKDGKVEIKSENEDMIQDGEVAVGSSDTKNADCQIDVKGRNLDFVESDVDIKVKDGESCVEKGDESNASVDGIGHPSLDDDDEKKSNLQGIDSASDVVQSGTKVVEAEPVVPHVEIEKQLHLGRSEEHENEVKGLKKLEEGIMKPEVVEDNINPHIAEVLVTDSEPVDGIITEPKPLEADSRVPHVEIEEQLHLGQSEEHENEVKELKKTEEGIMKPEVVEDDANLYIAEVLVTDSKPIDITKSKPLEADVKRESQEDGSVETQPSEGNFKAADSDVEKLVPYNAITEKQSRQQELQPGDIREPGPVKAEAEVRELGDMGSSGMNGSQGLNSVDTEAAVYELQQSAESEVKDQDASELTTEPEECQEVQAVPESEGSENQSNLELMTSEVDRPVVKISEQSDEATIESTAEVNGIPETSTEVVRSDHSDKSEVDQELERVDGEAKAELTAQSGGSLKSLVEEVSHQDQVAEETGLVDVIDKEVYSDDLTFEKTISLEEATNLSVPKAANEAVVNKEGQDLDTSHLGDGVAEQEVQVSESSRDFGGCLRSEDAVLNVPVCNEVDLPEPCDSDVGVIVEDGSCAGDNSISSLANDSCSPSKLENSDNALQYSVNGANLDGKPVNGEVNVASRTNCDFQDILKPKISFGSFKCVAPFSQNDNINIRTDVLNRSTELVASHSDFVGNSESVVDTANGATLFSSGANDVHSTEFGHDKTCAGEVSSEKISTEEVSASLLEGSGADSSDGHHVNTDLVRRPFYYLIRIPRFDDVMLSEQIKLSEEEVQKKTQNRDAVRTEYQNRKAIYWEYKTNFEAARSEERAAHRLLIAKKREIDSAQSLINLAKNAITIEDVDSQILKLEHRIQHETLDLAEEKRLVREIKQLNRQREQLAGNTQRQQELQQALDQRVEKEEHLKVLRKEMDDLRENHAKAEECFKAAKKKYDEESTLLNDLKVRFTSADDIRQEAYARLQTLKKQAFEKNKLFYNYKDAAKAANDFVVAGKKDSLEQHCVNQVEKIMELWNNNDEFRKEYIRCNQRSMLRRFKTLDGRSLGPDEEQLSLGKVSDNKVNGVAKVNSVATVATLERDFSLVAKNAQEESSKKVTEQKNKISLGKKRGETTSKDSLAEPSGRMEIEAKKEEEEEVNKLTKEEEELARKEEQKRREEEAVRLRELRREEEKVKAQEAQERKKRMAEKAQARAEFRARKAAEEKEKEREKKAKKKQKKKGIISENTEIEPAQLPESSPLETIRKPEVSEKPMMVTKKSHKPALYTKQVKTIKSISAPPASLRNRGKRRVPQWVWWLIVAILSVILIFPLGNIDIVGRFRHFTSGPFQ